MLKLTLALFALAALTSANKLQAATSGWFKPAASIPPLDDDEHFYVDNLCWDAKSNPECTKNTTWVRPKDGVTHKPCQWKDAGRKHRSDSYCEPKKAFE